VLETAAGRRLEDVVETRVGKWALPARATCVRVCACVTAPGGGPLITKIVVSMACRMLITALFTQRSLLTQSKFYLGIKKKV
jgi:hypothetical protein